MRTLLSLITAIIIIGMVSFTSQQTLKITSTSFVNKGMIPVKYSCEGGEINPPLHIGNIPAAAKSIALILHDPDAPKAGGFTHWVLWNAATDGNIPEDYKGAQQGLNGSGAQGYKGMCPPSGQHRYYFYVYALDAILNINVNTDKAALEKAMAGHILAKGELMGLYEKTKQ